MRKINKNKNSNNNTENPKSECVSSSFKCNSAFIHKLLLYGAPPGASIIECDEWLRSPVYNSTKKRNTNFKLKEIK